MRGLRAIVLAISLSVTHYAVAAEQVSVYAAGSLRLVLTDIAKLWEATSGAKVVFTFGASGLLKERIEKGEAAAVFASANTEHPAALVKAGLARDMKIFTRNDMCVLHSPKVNATADSLLALMLDPTIKLGTSTPKADPSGDYAWMVFERAEKIRAGAFAQLDAKALKLTGGRDSPPPPVGRNVYGELVATGKADMFLTYCTNAVQAIKEQPTLKSIGLDATLAVGADYGVAVMKKAGSKAEAFAAFLFSPQAQAQFRQHGFGAVGPSAAGR